jgi:hypothetical protein
VKLEDFRRAAIQRQSNKVNEIPGTLSEFIHTVRLRRIQSAILRRVYRVDRSFDVSSQVVEGLLNELSEWHSTCPPSDDPTRVDLRVSAFPLENGRLN